VAKVDRLGKYFTEKFGEKLGFLKLKILLVYEKMMTALAFHKNFIFI
jgi:hypothetical protein